MKLGVIFLAMLLLPLVPLTAQEVAPDSRVGHVSVEAYYGSMPYYTAFHQFMTTRLSILKASRDSQALTAHLRLTDQQRMTIEGIRIADGSGLSDDVRETMPNQNLQVDEFALDPNFYNFLDPEQHERLDRLAIEFDGYAGLALTSIAERLDLSQETRGSIRVTLSKNHESRWLPYFRYEFAGRLPPDYKYRRCVVAGQYALVIDGAIHQVLVEEEKRRLSNWLSKAPPPHAVIEAVRQLAPLPEGLFSLAKYYER